MKNEKSLEPQFKICAGPTLALCSGSSALPILQLRIMYFPQECADPRFHKHGWVVDNLKDVHRSGNHHPQRREIWNLPTDYSYPQRQQPIQSVVCVPHQHPRHVSYAAAMVASSSLQIENQSILLQNDKSEYDGADSIANLRNRRARGAILFLGVMLFVWSSLLLAVYFLQPPCFFRYIPCAKPSPWTSSNSCCPWPRRFFGLISR